jgi:hypothetical protein
VKLRGTLRAILTSAALVAGGCDYVCYVRREADSPGVQSDAVLAALRAEPSFKTKLPRESGTVIRLGGADHRAMFHCEQDGVPVNVLVRSGPDSIQVSVTTLNRRVRAADKAAWTPYVETICAAISQRVPGVGPWRVTDQLEPSSWVAVPGLVFLALIGAVIGISVRNSRRAARARKAATAAEAGTESGPHG